MLFSKPATLTSTSLTALPAYSSIRPHHLLLLYPAYHLLALLSHRHLTKLSDRLTALLSHLSNLALPLLYSKYTSPLLPDSLLRLAIRTRCRHTLLQLRAASITDELQHKMTIVQELQSMPIAIDTDKANEQHYEVPAKFYDLCLGPNKKYSCGLWENLPSVSSCCKYGRIKDGRTGLWLSPTASLARSEEAMLDLYLDRAQITDGMRVVDLGCGWGSLTLHLAKRYPHCQITAISNSKSQREYILRTAKERGYKVENIRVITCDVSRWEEEEYASRVLEGVEGNDRVLSIEMFEHMKNYSTLLRKIHTFLSPTGKLFVHIFSHKHYAYHFADGWMASTFFTGGTMPSDDLLLYFGQHFSVERHWRVNGSNYEKTSNAWLGLMDENWRKGELESVLEEAYGVGRGREWYVNWRLFYLACAELFGMNGGEEWIVSHYLFERRG
eukprot:CCRYP_010114-RC/>CCRYP_010114-RC protein AED:0.28 eAED:0.28 QI:111/1/1/1/1/1/2/563/441